MLFSIFTTIFLLTLTTTARPASYCALPATPFYLVTTSSSSCSTNSSGLPSVSATSLFGPPGQSTLLLRTIAPGYFSLPNFTMADGTLSSLSDGPFGAKTQLYNSTFAAAGAELAFANSPQGNGSLSLVGGYLLANGGATEGWTLCIGNETLGQSVLVWKGTDSSCNATYVQAVSKPPY